MFRSTHLLWYFVSKGGFIFRFIDTLLSIKPAYLVCISQHAVNINNIRWVLCWNTTSTKTSAVFPSQPSCNISTVLCRAVSGMPPAQWRGVGIHQHTGKWEWGLNNRALSHCHSARYVGRHCLESALLVSGTKNKRRKEKKKKPDSGSWHYWEDSTWLLVWKKSSSMKLLSGLGAAASAVTLTHSIMALLTWFSSQLQ